MDYHCTTDVQYLDKIIFFFSLVVLKDKILMVSGHPGFGRGKKKKCIPSCNIPATLQLKQAFEGEPLSDNYFLRRFYSENTN